MGTLVRVASDFVFRDPALKVLALLLAGILFVSTRDQVTRSFEIPIRVIKDPKRVLMTELPATAHVKVRGPWTRVNRLQEYDFGIATLDLSQSQPGQLRNVDEGTIVMPPGVLLVEIDYDHVDIRFDDVIDRRVSVTPSILGRVAADYRLVRVETNPPRWSVRGGRTRVQGVTQLTTEAMDIAGLTRSVTRTLSIVAPAGEVELVQTDSAGNETDIANVVEVRAVVEPLIEVREYAVPVPVSEELDPTHAIPPTYQVEVSGPLPTFRVLEGLETAFPVEVEVVALEGKRPDGGRVVEMRFGWSSKIPSDVRSALRIDHGVERVNLPAPPPPPAQPEAPPV